MMINKKEIIVYNPEIDYAEHVYHNALKWIERHPSKANTLEFELITAAAALALSKIDSLKKKKYARV